jgi:hypothetical protein
MAMLLVAAVWVMLTARSWKTWMTTLTNWMQVRQQLQCFMARIVCGNIDKLDAGAA